MTLLVSPAAPSLRRTSSATTAPELLLEVVPILPRLTFRGLLVRVRVSMFTAPVRVVLLV
jgi:hypothetical protein